MKVLSAETKEVKGREFVIVKGWAAKGFSESDYRSEIESRGGTLVHFKKLAGDKVGNVFDVILSF